MKRLEAAQQDAPLSPGVPAIEILPSLWVPGPDFPSALSPDAEPPADLVKEPAPFSPPRANVRRKAGASDDIPPDTRPAARPLEWPPEPYRDRKELPRGDEWEHDKNFKSLRVPLGQIDPSLRNGKRVATFTAAASEPRPARPGFMSISDTPSSRALPGSPDIFEGNAAVVSDVVPPASYFLGAGDKLRITVFGEPELSGEFTVGEAGQISYPLIGEVPVRELSVLQARDAIAARLREGYLRNPNIVMEISEFRPFYITGEVRAPGSYSYVADMSVMNAVVMAGGFTFRARQSGVEIMRNKGADTEMLKDIKTGAKVQPGDIILVKERFF